jgi:hypothetical protein
MSLKKIFTAIIGTMFLIHLKDMLRALEPAYFWFCDSLHGLRDFDEGAQAAIAVYTIIAIVVLTLRAFNKF